MKRLIISLLTLTALALFLVGPAAAGHHSKDLVDTAVEAGSFKTLTAALKAVGLDEALRAEGPFTVFAATDEAFAKLPEGTVESLLKPANKDKLIKILSYHVIRGSVASNQVQDGAQAATLNGQKVRFTANGSGVRVNSSNVVKADIRASNGIIHAIDAVLLPTE